MGLAYDATGVDANGGFPVIEFDGFLPFRIVSASEGESKNGDYQVTVDCVCLDARWKDYGVRNWVTFLDPKQKGAGLAIHFLKCIGEPHEGKIKIEPMSWERKTFMGKVIVSTYEGKRNNKFAEVAPMQKGEEIPFGDAPADAKDTAPWD